MTYIPNKPYDLSFKDGILVAIADLRKHFPEEFALADKEQKTVGDLVKDKDGILRISGSALGIIIKWSAGKITNNELRDNPHLGAAFKAGKKRLKVLITIMRYEQRVARVEKAEKAEAARQEAREARREERRATAQKIREEAALKATKKRPGPYYVQALWKKLDGMEKNQKEILRCVRKQK